MFSSYLSKKRIRSERTAEVYANCISLWSRSRGFDNPDLAIRDIKDRNLDPYEVLQEWVNSLHEKHKAPKTILSYYTAVKGFLVDSDIDVTVEKVRAKIVLPQAFEISTDRAPTHEEVRRILLRSRLGTKTAITLLASSGFRLGELARLKVSDVEFGEKGEPSKVTLRASTTKTRRRRLTFISPEASEFLREHLGERITDRNARIFTESSDALYGKIMRVLIATGLRTKEDSDSARYALHPHSLRKYFFSNCLAAGIDRGLVEGFMGHSFGLDSAYLRLSDEELAKEYQKAADRLTFLTTTTGITDQQLSETLQERDGKIERLEAQIQHLTGLVLEKLKIVMVACKKCHETEDVTGPDENDNFRCHKCGSKEYEEIKPVGPVRIIRDPKTVEGTPGSPQSSRRRSL